MKNILTSIIYLRQNLLITTKITKIFNIKKTNFIPHKNKFITIFLLFFKLNFLIYILLDNNKILVLSKKFFYIKQKINYFLFLRIYMLFDVFISNFVLNILNLLFLFKIYIMY